MVSCRLSLKPNQWLRDYFDAKIWTYRRGAYPKSQHPNWKECFHGPSSSGKAYALWVCCFFLKIFCLHIGHIYIIIVVYYIYIYMLYTYKVGAKALKQKKRALLSLLDKPKDRVIRLWDVRQLGVHQMPAASTNIFDMETTRHSQHWKYWGVQPTKKMGDTTNQPKKKQN